MPTSANLLEQRLALLESSLAIRDLKSRYWRAVDQQRLDIVRECLAADAQVDMEGVGTMSGEAFIAFIERNGCQDGVFNLHAGQNPVIRLTDNDCATGEWDMWFTSVDTHHRQTIQMTGYYIDEYRKIQDQWLITAMTFRQRSFLMHQYNDQAAPTAMTLGQSNNNAFGQ